MPIFVVHLIITIIIMLDYDKNTTFKKRNRHLELSEFSITVSLNFKASSCINASIV